MLYGEEVLLKVINRQGVVLKDIVVPDSAWALGRDQQDKFNS